ncbi:Rv1733c family protein [Prauserella muralis]|uniref:Uncharacterized protein n=1 Tax=Prauserella muralis TaxID=588067 RepID=A0A2V4APD5_9PSEU|nr:hypothetical protein [Prauserella muralis]PXY22318.1 hypothetical protein BAY60_20820 [Prauserella muralis]TWE27968.1 hypothetical protein FHX69_0617 [Prauserella muralis]
MGPSGGRAARFWRWLHPGRNPLSRPGDRLQARLFVVLLLLVLLAVPVAASVGSETYAGRMEVAERDADAKHRATAVLLADAPVSMGVGELETTPVRARWQTPDGTTRTGEVAAYRGSTTGSRIPVWLDDEGNLTTPPVTTAAAATDGVSVGISVWLAVAGVCAAVFAAVHGVLHRLRLAQWARDWARVEREWTRH